MFGDSYGHAGDPSATGRLRVARYVLRGLPNVKLFRAGFGQGIPVVSIDIKGLAGKFGWQEW